MAPGRRPSRKSGRCLFQNADRPVFRWAGAAGKMRWMMSPSSMQIRCAKQYGAAAGRRGRVAGHRHRAGRSVVPRCACCRRVIRVRVGADTRGVAGRRRRDGASADFRPIADCIVAACLPRETLLPAMLVSLPIDCFDPAPSTTAPTQPASRQLHHQTTHRSQP